ncbi:hypothetical protein OHJ16_04345 [Actinomyces israelii]|uniref:Uncharacterized protein n=1 Tax=Actinomyces israelii TaxID=1659 RepID=A0ABT4I6B9_9ACTO|nr:hypothetical protein [Actinomyces israelii]MCZ0857271.1 hypothetical protein [Actinomyces israelii]
MQIDMTNEERDIPTRWKKRSDTYRLVRMKAERFCTRRSANANQNSRSSYPSMPLCLIPARTSF